MDNFSILDEENIHPELFCCICYNILVDPISLTCCLNTFCNKCISNAHNCPICRKQIMYNTKQEIPLILKNILGKIKIKCDLCDTELLMENRQKHGNCTSTCLCGKILSVNNKLKHIDECDLCNTELLMENQQKHGNYTSTCLCGKILSVNDKLKHIAGCGLVGITVDKNIFPRELHLKFVARDKSIFDLDCGYDSVYGFFGIYPFTKINSPKGIAYVCGIRFNELNQDKKPEIWLRLENEKVISYWNDISDYQSFIGKTGFKIIRNGGTIEDILPAVHNQK